MTASPSINGLPSTSTSEPPQLVLMPDLRGLTTRAAGSRIGRLEQTSQWGLTSSWEGQFTVGCDVRPDTVVSQRPAPGEALERGETIDLRFAVPNLKRFRGPCEPSGGSTGPVRGADAKVARAFYRFAADPSLGGPFGSEDIWVGIESGQAFRYVPADQRDDLRAWGVGEGYAERMGPFSPLDVLASSGGYYEVHRGIVPTCGFQAAGEGAPPELRDLRALTMIARRDVVTGCMEWWGVTLFLDSQSDVRGVALRLGSP